MLLPWDAFARMLVQGAVIRDSHYVFPDKTVKAKYLLFLTGLLDDNTYAYCLTTSQVGTYDGSFSTYLKASDPALGDDIIIELERIGPVRAIRLKEKYEAGFLDYKGRISEGLLQEALEKIAESPRIAEHLKKLINL